MVAVVNAATLALIDAGIAMKDYVTACSAGCIDGTNVLESFQFARQLKNSRTPAWNSRTPTM